MTDECSPTVLPKSFPWRDLRFLLEDGWRLEPEWEKEMLVTKVVSNGVECVSGYPDGEGRHERETDEAVTPVPRERVRQLTPSRPKANGSNKAAATAAVKSAGEARPHGIAKQSATTKPELAKTSGGAGSPWSRAGGTNSAVATADAMPADEARLPGCARRSTTTESALAVSPGDAGSSGSSVQGSWHNRHSRRSSRCKVCCLSSASWD